MALDPNYFLPLMAFNTRTLLALAHDDMQVTQGGGGDVQVVGAGAVHLLCWSISPEHLNPET